MTKFNVQVGYAAHYANQVEVEARTIAEACEKAIEKANDDSGGWKSTDHVSNSFVDAISKGAGVDPWFKPLPFPREFDEASEHAWSFFQPYVVRWIIEGVLQSIASFKSESDATNWAADVHKGHPAAPIEVIEVHETGDVKRRVRSWRARRAAA